MAYAYLHDQAEAAARALDTRSVRPGFSGILFYFIWDVFLNCPNRQQCLAVGLQPALAEFDPQQLGLPENMFRNPWYFTDTERAQVREWRRRRRRRVFFFVLQF